MKHLLLALCLIAVGTLHAIDNNVELIKNKDFSDPALFATQLSLAVTDPTGKWFTGNIAQFTSSIASGAFESTSTSGGTFYNYFLGQITSELLNTGSYHLSLRAKGTAPFFLKLSGTNALGTELLSSLKNVSGSIVISSEYAGYSIKFTPTADWSTLEADLNVIVPTNATARIYFVFPNAGSVALDDVSFMRTKDFVTFSTYYVRPDGDNSSWSNLTGIDPDQIITSNSPIIIGTSSYYFAKGTYTKSAVAMTTGKLYGGFKGDETTIDLSARALSDKDANGIIEPWEFTNETVITGTNPISGAASGNRLITVTGGEINGFTLQDQFRSNTGVILLGSVTTTPTAVMDVETNGGKMINCIVKKIKSSSSAPIMTTNQYSLIDACLIEECGSTLNGSGATGAVFMNLLGGKISNSVIRNNAAVGGTPAYTGAIRASALTDTDMNSIIENCLIYNNSTSGQCGAIYCEAKANRRGIQVVNCTVVNNKSTTYASLNFIESGLLVNSIVVDDPLNEVRANKVNNYISNCAIGQLATPLTNYYPNTDVVTELTANDFYFVRSTTFPGAMQPGNTDFDQAKYDEIRTANFKITQTYSAAITTPALKTLPNSYQIAGSMGTVGITASIPTKDIIGTSRPITNAAKEVTLGAYQYSTATGLHNVVSKYMVYGTNASIVINNAEGMNAMLFSISGQLVKSIKVTSNLMYIPTNKGFYLISVGGEKSKVFVR
jgi:hypothetical protein